jgi:ribosomal protein L11
MYTDKHFYFPFVGLPTGVGLDQPLSLTGGATPAISFWDDFVSGSITAGQAYASATTTATLGVTAVTSAEPGGAIQVAVTGTAGNAGIRTNMPVRISAGKAFTYSVRIKAPSIVDTIYVGMEAGSANPFTGTNCKGALFFINAADIKYGAIGTAGASLATPSTTISTGLSLVANTYVDLAICWTGSETCFFVNGALVAKSTVSLAGLDLYPVVGAQNTTGNKNVIVDYHGFQMQR